MCVCVFQARKDILKIHTRQWKPPPSEDFLDELSEKCVGEKNGSSFFLSQENVVIFLLVT